MKVLFYQKENALWEKLLPSLRASFPDAVLVFDPDPRSLECTDADVIIGGILPRSLLERSVNLKLVIVPFVGVDHLPLQYFKERGIRVANSHGNADSVAERSLGMILALYGKIISHHEDLKKGLWHGFWVGRGLDDSWESIHGKCCSIIGAGKIGTSLARMMKAFHCTVTGFKKRNVNEFPSVYDEMIYDFSTAVKKSEIVVNLLPLTRETENIFDADIFRHMEGKVFVNAGRGGTVNEKALFEALKHGILKGAALDAWFIYPPDGATTGFPSRYPFQNLDNVVLSPHIAGFTRQAAAENIHQAFDNLVMFLRTGEVVSEVNREAGY